MSDKFTALRNKFLSSFPAKLEGIKEAREENDMQLTHDLIHKLAGSSGGYGFDEISLHCRSILTQLYESKDKTNKEIDEAISHLLKLLSSAL